MSKLQTFSFLQKLLLSIILLWLFVATFRTLYNVSKLFTEERSWFVLPQPQRFVRAYGDREIIYQRLTMQMKDTDCMLLQSSGDTSYFLLRYLLYPKKLYSLNNGYSLQQNEQKQCHYLLLYQVTNEDAALSFSLATHKDIQLIDRFATSIKAKIGSYVYQIK